MIIICLQTIENGENNINRLVIINFKLFNLKLFKLTNLDRFIQFQINFE